MAQRERPRPLNQQSNVPGPQLQYNVRRRWEIMVGREGDSKISPKKRCAQGGTTAALVSKKAQTAELETPSSGVHIRSESFDEKWRGRYCWSSSRRCEHPHYNACKGEQTGAS